MATLILLCACFSAADAPGRFDYYVLSLSWSPQYCAQARGHEPQCARPYAFVVHGLWPQYERGYPSDCRTHARVAEATIDRMLPIMPSRSLVIHEWRAHGSCSGSSPHAYFADVERAYNSIRVSDTRWTQATRLQHRHARPLRRGGRVSAGALSECCANTEVTSVVGTTHEIILKITHEQTHHARTRYWIKRPHRPSIAKGNRLNADAFCVEQKRRGRRADHPGKPA